MVDLFDKLKMEAGPLAKYSHLPDDYFFFPKLEGEIGPRMKFNGKTVLNWSLNNYLGLANHPEVRKADADSAADVYALGVTFIELLSGVVPTPHAIGARAFADPSDDPGLNELIRHMVSFAAHDRPSLAEIKARLT